MIPGRSSYIRRRDIKFSQYKQQKTVLVSKTWRQSSDFRRTAKRGKNKKQNRSRCTMICILLTTHTKGSDRLDCVVTLTSRATHKIPRCPAAVPQFKAMT